MAGLRVFISSTCFDLGSNRDQLRLMLSKMGYEPIMSEYSDILYDPKDHTHISCINDVANADMIVLMIGSRLGGSLVEQALPIIDFNKIEKSSKSIEIIAQKENISITQAETLKAIELDIPLFAFVDEKVYSDHELYQKNKLSPFIDQIHFPSIDKPSTAKYIFEFINLVRHRTTNNAIVSYKSFSDIEEHLTKQWSLLFQRLLKNRRDSFEDQRRSDILIDQIEGLKAVVLQSISTDDARLVATSVLRFRRLADIIVGLRDGPKNVDIYKFTGNFNDLLKAYGIVDTVKSSNSFGTYLILDDETYYRSRMPIEVINRAGSDWIDFRDSSDSLKKAVIDAILSTNRAMPIIRYYNEKFEDMKARTELEGAIKEIEELIESEVQKNSTTASSVSSNEPN